MSCNLELKAHMYNPYCVNFLSYILIACMSISFPELYEICYFESYDVLIRSIKLPHTYDNEKEKGKKYIIQRTLKLRYQT